MENQKTDKLAIVKKLDESIQLGRDANTLQGFDRAYKLAEASENLTEALTSTYMKPIMHLQGNKLGFLTDRDRQSGYDEKTVKKCLIEAVLTGVQVVGNHFNIISSNCYITKEGFGYILKNTPGLAYEIIPQLPRIPSDRKSAAIKMDITWTIQGGKRHKREIDFPIKMNEYMGTDAVIGKATRKARAWLYNTISGLEVADGDAYDVTTEIVESKKELSKEITSKVSDTIEKKQEMQVNKGFDAEKLDERVEEIKSNAKKKVTTKEKKPIVSDSKGDISKEKEKEVLDTHPEEKPFVIPEIPEGKKEREFGDMQNLYHWLEDMGLDEMAYKIAVTELLQIEKEYPNMEELCKRASNIEVEKVFDKFKQFKK